MICVKTWENKTVESVGGWDEWVKFINTNVQYCINESTVWDFVGKCESWDLPSEHPYWGYVFKGVRQSEYEKHFERFKECEKSPEKIKYYYNDQTSLKNIMDKMKACKNSVEEYESKLRYGS